MYEQGHTITLNTSLPVFAHVDGSPLIVSGVADVDGLPLIAPPTKEFTVVTLPGALQVLAA